VIYRGNIVEQGPTNAVFDNPQHDYTRALVDAVPKPFSGRRKRARRSDSTLKLPE
jgi:peptide/nickel transport system ATP-binding protein